MIDVKVLTAVCCVKGDTPNQFDLQIWFEFNFCLANNTNMTRSDGCCDVKRVARHTPERTRTLKFGVILKYAAGWHTALSDTCRLDGSIVDVLY
jgi:hypothetical protein